MNITDKFDQYLENKLSKDERAKFEIELREQEELNELYKSYLHINRILKKELYSPVLNTNEPLLEELSTSQRIEIEKDFIRFHKRGESEYFDSFLSDDEKNDLSADPANSEKSADEARFVELLTKIRQGKTTRKNNKILPYLGIAAAVAISLFAGKQIFEFIFSGRNDLTPQQIYIAFYDPGADNELKNLEYKDLLLNSDIDETKDSNIRSSFPDAEQLNNSETVYELSLLFQGLISMERTDFQEAQKCFKQISLLENPTKQNSANYYLSLLYINMGEIKEARIILEELSKIENPYQKKAGKILRSLKQK